MLTLPTQTDPTLDFAKAYQLQRQLVAGRAQEAGGVIGYKLSPRRGIEAATGQPCPIYGTLLYNMLLADGATIVASEFSTMLLESEVAFLIEETVPAAEIKSADDLLGFVQAVALAVEIPNYQFAVPIAEINGIDLVATNVSAAKLMVGVWQPALSIDVERVQVATFKDGGEEPLSEGDAMMVEGSPWNMLFWLVRCLASEGRALEKGQLVMSGAMGPVLQGAPGQYRVSSPTLGELQFTVQ